MIKITDIIIKKFKEYLINEEKSKASQRLPHGSAVRSSARQGFWNTRNTL